MNCIIIDDEKTSRVILKTLCDQTNLNVINEFSNAIEAIKYLNNHDVDVVFLDYHMPSFNGLDFIKTLKKPINIILTTSDPKFAIEAFEYDFIIDYLLKPIEISRFKKSIYKVTNKLVSPTDVTKQPEILILGDDKLLNQYYSNSYYKAAMNRYRSLVYHLPYKAVDIRGNYRMMWATTSIATGCLFAIHPLLAILMTYDYYLLLRGTAVMNLSLIHI